MLVVIVKIVLFLLLYFISRFLYQIIMEQNLPFLAVKIMYKRSKQEAWLREEKEKRFREEEGRREKIYFLRRMDLLIRRSGISVKFPFMNTGIYLLLTLSFLILGAIISTILSNSPIVVLMISLIILFTSYLILYVLSGISYRNTEENILEFTNLLENFSKTNNDIVTILYKVYPYLNNPLHDAVEECVSEARSTGDVSRALLNLEHKIELDKFKEIIRNIEISSRYEANYEEIIRDSRRMLREYIAAREERRALIKNSRIEMGIIIICCVFIIKMLDSFSTVGVVNVLLHSLVGNILLGYCIVVLFLGFWTLLAIDK